MSSQRELLCTRITWTAGMVLATFLFVIPARAQGNSSDYLFFVGSGFLCQPNDSSACPAVTKSAGGSTYELSGTGTFNLKNRSAMATGTFAHKSPDGSFLETGIWIADQMVSFYSYGVARDVLMREGWAFGLSDFGLRRMPMLSSFMPTGGLAAIRIRLLPMRGPSRTAVLQVNCALGKVPEERQTEGIRLSFEGSGGEFDQEISGRTMFVSERPGANPASERPTALAERILAPAAAQQ